MGIATVLAAILICMKAAGLTTIAWGWCFAPLVVDVLLVIGVATLGFKTTKMMNKAFAEHGKDFNKGFDAMEARINAAKDKLG